MVEPGLERGYEMFGTCIIRQMCRELKYELSTGSCWLWLVWFGDNATPFGMLILYCVRVVAMCKFNNIHVVFIHLGVD